MNWPLGSGDEFAGVFDRRAHEMHLFERAAHGTKRAAVSVADVADPRLRALVSDHTYDRFREGIELLDGAGEQFDRAAMLRGEITPVFFGSAVTNFGVQLFLDEFVEMAPPPGGACGDRPGRRELHRLRLQDPGEHGSAPSRSRRLRARLFG